MGESSFGKYRLIAELGHGGMADVFLAVVAGPAGSGFSKLTVIKRLRQNLAEEPEFIAMLVDEARIAARLNHPNVVQTNEVGQVGSQYFLAMEYLDGQPLHRIQHRAMVARKEGLHTTPLPPEPVSGTHSPSLLMPAGDPFPADLQYIVLLDTLAGLHHAHELADYDGTPLKIVHRDVTPHNIFVTYEGQVKVVDFGIAKAVGRASETRQGVVKGKVRYMAPEQAIGQTVDCRADVFSVGVMLWEAATGQRLWKDMDDLQIVQALVMGEIKSSPRAVNPDVPEGIDAICKKALAGRVQDRYASAEAMRLDLEQYLAESGKLVEARRKVGPAAAQLFKDKRSEIRNVIEKQLAALKTRPGSEFAPVEIPDASMSNPTPSSTGTLSVSVGPEDGTLSLLADAAKTELYTSSPRKKDSRSKRLAVVGLVGLGVIGVTVAVAMGSNKGKAPEAVAAPSEPAKASDVTVKLSTTPDNAQVTIDGEPFAAPFELKRPRDAKEHTVRVEAAGYEPQTQKVQFASDLALVFTLAKSAAVAAPSPPQSVANVSVKKGGPPPRWQPAPTPPKSTAQATTPDPTPQPPPANTVGSLPPPPPKTKPNIDNGDPWQK